MIASIAMVVQQLAGLAGEAEGLARQHQANTINERRVLSVFFLGGILLGRGERLSTRAISQAVRKLRREISTPGVTQLE